MPGLARLLVVTVACAVLVACGRPVPQIEQIKQRGELVVVTRSNPTTYYEGADGPEGFEYELAERFAASLGVALRVVVAPTVTDLFRRLRRREVDFAAAGLTITKARTDRYRFTPPYYFVKQQLIYREGTPRPKSVDDLSKGTLEVIAASSHVERLRELRKQHPGLAWNENSEYSSVELLELVWEQLIDYTVLDSNEFAVQRHIYPELKVAFDLTGEQPLGWAFLRRKDSTLYDAAVAFLKGLEDSGELALLIDRFFGHVDRFSYVGSRTFKLHVLTRLPRYAAMLKDAADHSGADWRLLAAMAYQESHWNSDAVSPTGVKGLMMLTKATARYLGIKDREDPEQSIIGGARYLQQLRGRIPEDIAEPDRTWLALAAYNVGLGHLEDARRITQKQGGNPDHWFDVKQRLPLLADPKWSKKTQHGSARGREPVRYVGNVRRYFDILVRMTEQKEKPDVPMDAFKINSPVL